MGKGIREIYYSFMTNMLHNCNKVTMFYQLVL